MSAWAAAWTAIFALMQTTIVAGIVARMWLAGHRGYACAVGVALAIPVAFGLFSAFGADEGAAFWYVVGSAAGLALALPVLGLTALFAVARSAARHRTEGK